MDLGSGTVDVIIECKAGTTWAGERSRWTLAFEALAVTVLRNARSATQAAEFLSLDWSSVQTIMKRAVERGLLRRSLEGIKHVSLDEKSFGKGQDYISVMSEPGASGFSK